MGERYRFQSKPRKRLLTKQPGWLKVCFGRLEGDAPDLIFTYGGGGVNKSHGHLMHALLGPFLKFPEGRITTGFSQQDFAAELDAAGFDLSTLEIRIKLRPQTIPEERNGNG